MSENKNLEEMYNKLKKGRDELKVKFGLGKLEARDAWDEAEKNFAQLELKMKALRDQGEHEVGRLGEDIRLLISDTKDAFERMRNRS